MENMQHKKVSNSVKFIYIATTHNNGHLDIEQRKKSVSSQHLSQLLLNAQHRHLIENIWNRRSLCQFKI